MTSILLGKRYEILEQIDSGGMADIYKAFCIKTNKIVALKLLKDKFSGNSEYVHRFKREAETVFSLDHENIVSVTDIGFDGGAYYLVMEYVEGSTLKALIEKNERIDENEAVQYAIQLCSALSAAHKKGIIHRDIKPHNILIDNNKKVKLTDFGIAKSISSDEEQEDKVIGSVHYISPEQARGERLDTRSDIYSLGIVLYEMLTGVLPHTGGKTVSVALKHINEQITPPSDIKNDISDALNYIILKATSKNKKDRYQSANQLKNDLVRSIKDPKGSFLDIREPDKKPVVDLLKLKKKNIIWKAGMLVLLIAVISSVAILILTLFNSSDASFVVPNLIGTDIDSAEKKLINLKVTTVYEPSESANEGTIISQSPEAGSKAVSGEPINLTISSGPADLIMPDLFGATLEDAETQIDAMGLTLDKDNIIYEDQPDISPGLIISQSPEAGEPLTGTDTLILTVSGERAEDGSLMPDLKDSLIDQAISLLSDTGFKNCFVYEDDKSDRAEGTVLSQSPEQGIQTAFSDNIYITISSYKNKPYKAIFIASVPISEKESIVRVVVEENVNGKTVNFIVDESNEEPGKKIISRSLSSQISGVKRVSVYVNNILVVTEEVTFS